MALEIVLVLKKLQFTDDGYMEPTYCHLFSPFVIFGSLFYFIFMVALKFIYLN